MNSFFNCFFLFGILLFCSFTQAQQDTAIYKTFGGFFEDNFSAVVFDTDSNLVYCGGSSSNSEYGKNGFILKTDTLLNLMWSRSYETVGSSEFTDMVSNDDGYFLTGRVLNPVTGYDVLIVHLDMNGEMIWDKQIGTSEWDEANSITITSNGILLSGSTYGNSSGHKDAVAHHLDFDGNLIWTRYYATENDDVFYDAHESLEGNYIFGGEITSSDGSSQMWFISSNESGSTLSQFTSGESGVNKISAILPDFQSEEYFFCGQIYNQENDSQEGVLARIDSQGSIIWEDTTFISGDQYWKNLEFGRYTELMAHGVTRGAPFGNEGDDFYILRKSRDNAFVNQLTHGGNGNDQIADGVRLPNGYIWVGKTDSYGEGLFDAFVIRTRNSGLDDLAPILNASLEIDLNFLGIENMSNTWPQSFYAQGLFYFEKQIAELSIYSMEGKLIERIFNPSSPLELNLRHGIYLFRSDDGISEKILAY